MNLPPDDLDPKALTAMLASDGPSLLAGPVLVLGRLTSTMDIARELAAAGAPEGTVVVADEQTDGRGRLGRTWLAPPGTSLLFTILLRPPLTVPLAQVPMAVALGALEAMRSTIAVQSSDSPASSISLKWPNDFVVRQGPELSKLGGLIAEILPPAGVEHDAGQGEPCPPVVLVGVGLNVSQRDAQLPLGATSLARLRLAAVDRGMLLAGILCAADRYYESLLAGTDLVPGWAHELETLGREVTVETPGGVATGVAVGVAADGALLVRDDEGEINSVYAGDVGMAPVPHSKHRRG